mgnify:CR=1 FL=1
MLNYHCERFRKLTFQALALRQRVVRVYRTVLFVDGEPLGSERVNRVSDYMGF